MKNIFYFLFIFILNVNTSIFAQKTLDKGTVKMEITKVGSDDPQTEMMLGAMKGSQTELVFDGQKHVTTMDMMGGMVKIQVHASKADNTMNMLFDAMGNKMWIESKLDESQTAQEKEIASKSEIKYDKNDTKEILGYKCYKMTVSNPELDGMSIMGYVSPDIKTKANVIQGFQAVEFEGYPMEYTISNATFSMTMTAVKVDDTIDAQKFNLDTKGYKKMTMDEFKSAMGGMGGGFGF